jgi:hypothetical protein
MCNQMNFFRTELNVRLQLFRDVRILVEDMNFIELLHRDIAPQTLMQLLPAACVGFVIQTRE